MICPQCGNSENAGARFCHVCGASLAVGTAPSADAAPNPYAAPAPIVSADPSGQVAALQNRFASGVPFVAICIAILAAAVVVLAVLLTFAFGLWDDKGSLPAAETAPGNVAVQQAPESDAVPEADGGSSGTDWVHGFEGTTGRSTNGLPIDHIADAPSEGSADQPLTSAEAYKLLVAYLQQADEYDSRVAESADDFNADFLSKDKVLRESHAKAASSLKVSVRADWDDVKGLSMPFWSANYEAWQDICELYECLWHRIEVIDRAWQISLTFEDPAGHEEEILAPIRADQESGQNKYYARYKELYPAINLVKP